MYDNVDLFDLERFVKAQDTYDSYNIALKEIKDGWKQSHWMWYVFPQVHGLGHSSTSQKFSIKSLLEALAYLRHDTLGKRLYEVMNALPIHGDAEEIFGKLDAMKLRSCLTLFDLVSPDEIFADFLENYFNKERCQKTRQIVSSELSYYKGDDAFTRNGIQSEVPRAFLEGIDGSDKLTYNNCLGTLLDLFGRGETMRMLVSRHLWNKEDFSVYRVSNVKFRILNYMETFFQKIADSAKDDALFNEMKDLYGRYALAEDNQLLQIADAFDEFWNKYKNDMRVKPVIDSYIKESLCKPIEQTPGRNYNGIIRPEYTPDAIDSLKSDEVFVFGSNLHGHHGGGAARAARKKFGAIWGQGVGLQGQSYAIPTMQGGVETIKPYVDQFVDFAKEHTELFFYVTRIGCGIAGFKDSDIAPLFKDAMDVHNICLPESFIKENNSSISPTVPQELLTMMYGQVRTLVDLLKELNKQEPIKDSDDARDRLIEITERNVRYGDEFAFMAMRTIWCIMSRYEQEGSKVDIEQLEKDMLSFHDGNQYLKENGIEQIFYNYSVRKMIKYIQFLNEFRRYSNYEAIRDDLQSIPVSHCSSNDPQYYFSFYKGPIWRVYGILFDEWENVTKDGILDNELLEQIAFGRFDNMVKEHGLKETIRLAYGDVGCHPDIQAPMRRREGTVWGPVYRIDGKHIEKGCSDFRRWPWTNTSFEMKFAHEILEKDQNYMFADSDWRGGLYLPVSDYTLPVYSRYGGRMDFESQEEKIKFIEEHKSGRNAD